MKPRARHPGLPLFGEFDAGETEGRVAAIEEGPFLSQEQKRDIPCNNAARFLRLSEAEIARHHAK